MECWTGDYKSIPGKWTGSGGDAAAAAATTDDPNAANADADGSWETYAGNRTVVWYFGIIICVSNDVLLRFYGDCLCV